MVMMILKSQQRLGLPMQLLYLVEQAAVLLVRASAAGSVARATQSAVCSQGPYIYNNLEDSVEVPLIEVNE